MIRKSRWYVYVILIVVMGSLAGCKTSTKSNPTSPTGGTVVHALPGIPPYLVEKDDGTINDAVTGLIWLKDPGCFGSLSWQDAKKAVARLGHGMCGLTDNSQAGDWRLPGVDEMLHIIDYAHDRPPLPADHSFQNILVGRWYWLGTSYAPDGQFAWSAFFYDGSLTGAHTSILSHIWPVKGQPAEKSPVFRDNQDGTVTDMVTGIIWLKNAGCFGTRPWDEAVEAVQKLENGQCGLLDNSNPGDWRLPDVEELRSIIDDTQFAPALPANHPFLNVQSDVFSDEYWTATLYVAVPHAAWIVPMYSGSVNGRDKASPAHVWAVRSGQSL